MDPRVKREMNERHGLMCVWKTLNQFQHPEQLFRGYPQSGPLHAQWIVSLSETYPPTLTSPTCSLCGDEEWVWTVSASSTTPQWHLNSVSHWARLLPFEIDYSLDNDLVAAAMEVFQTFPDEFTRKELLIGHDLKSDQCLCIDWFWTSNLLVNPYWLSLCKLGVLLNATLFRNTIFLLFKLDLDLRLKRWQSPLSFIWYFSFVNFSKKNKQR